MAQAFLEEQPWEPFLAQNNDSCEENGETDRQSSVSQVITKVRVSLNDAVKMLMAIQVACTLRFPQKCVASEELGMMTVLKAEQHPQLGQLAWCTAFPCVGRPHDVDQMFMLTLVCNSLCLAKGRKCENHRLPLQEVA